MGPRPRRRASGTAADGLSGTARAPAWRDHPPDTLVIPEAEPDAASPTGSAAVAALVLALDDPGARDPSAAGAKAAALAAARARGFPVLPGFVVTATAAHLVADPGGDLPAAFDPLLRRAWDRLSRGGSCPLVVRSSSTVEDSELSSMAGRFTSVLDVSGWHAFRSALARVVASAHLGDGSSAPMAVLVQRQLDARRGGVLFVVDPVSGRTDRMVIAVVDGRPDALVSGRATGRRVVTTRSGRQVDGERALSLRHRIGLARLGRHASRAFGGPQDIEWAHDRDGHLWLLQSRPVTAVAAPSSGPVLGQGPLAETFPDALAPLERDLWLEPLRTAVVAALRVAGTAGRALERSPVVTAVHGHVVGDLTLLGVAPRKRSLWGLLDPRPGARRLRAAWRMGGLRSTLPQDAARTVRDVDAALATVPHPSGLPDQALLDLLLAWQEPLVVLHTREILAGFLLGTTAPATSAAAVALRRLAAGRAAGLSDAALRARHPVVLALSPPAVGPARPLPAGAAPAPPPQRAAAPLEVAREALRLRVRLVQELQARAAWELAGRLGAAGIARGGVRWLRLDELRAAVEAGAVPHDLPARTAEAGGTLPAAFRLATDGRVVPVEPPGRQGARGGTGASGGFASGRVHSDGGVPEPGSILVVRTLDPALAPLLPGLAGLVAETGSALSHLAILAREHGIPAVVGLAGAVERFPHGTVVTVDGTTGQVRAREEVR